MFQFKPIKRRDYEKAIKQFGWSLQKGSIDWNLIDENGNFVCTIKVTHPGGEVPATHVKKTESHLKSRALI